MFPTNNASKKILYFDDKFNYDVLSVLVLPILSNRLQRPKAMLNIVITRTLVAVKKEDG